MSRFTSSIPTVRLFLDLRYKSHFVILAFCLSAIFCIILDRNQYSRNSRIFWLPRSVRTSTAGNSHETIFGSFQRFILVFSAKFTGLYLCSVCARFCPVEFRSSVFFTWKLVIPYTCASVRYWVPFQISVLSRKTKIKATKRPNFILDKALR